MAYQQQRTLLVDVSYPAIRDFPAFDDAIPTFAASIPLVLLHFMSK